MPSTYTLNNGIELIATGEQSGTWGDTTNTNLSLLDTALDGQVTVTLPSAGTSGSPNTLAISDGAASDGRNRMVIFNDGGDLGATAYVQLTPNDAEKIIYVRNDLAGSRSIILFQGTYNASNDYEVPAGTTAVIFFDGAGSGAVAANVFNNAYFDSLRLGSVSVTEIIDDDTMATAAATNIATSESIKAYVDAQVGANNELSEVLANGNTSGGNAIQMTTTDELQFRDTALKISSSADGQLDIDADTEIEIVAPTVDIDASTAMTIDTAALTVTGAVDFNTSLNVDGTITSDGLTVDAEFATIQNADIDNGATLRLDNSTNSTSGWGLGKVIGTLEYYLSNETSATERVRAKIELEQNNTTTQYPAQADLNFYTTSSNNSPRKNMTIASNGDITFYDTSGNASFVYDESAGSTFNENGDNKDFRVESDGQAHMLFVDASTDRVGVGTSTPASLLTVQNAVGPVIRINSSASSTGGVLVISDAGTDTAYFATANHLLSGGSSSDTAIRANGSFYLAAGGNNERMSISSTGTVVFNDIGADADFRVESNNNANMLFVDAGADKVSVGTATSTRVFNVNSTTADSYIHFTNTNSVSGTNGGGDIGLYDNGTDPSAMLIVNREAGGKIALSDNVNTFFDADSSEIAINENGANIDFRVESDTNANMLFVDAGNSYVGIGTGVPQTQLHVRGGSTSTLAIGGVGSNETARLLLAESMNGSGEVDYGFSFVGDGAATNDLIISAHDNNTTGVEQIRIERQGGVTINETGADTDFRVESDANANCFKIDASADAGQGTVMFGQSVASSSTTGGYFSNSAGGFFHLVVVNSSTTSTHSCLYLNRQAADGNLVEFRQADSQEGTISVSGSTVSYNGFAGRHESSGIPTTTVKGTVVSTIDELDVYVSGAKQGQTRADHAKVKISDTAGESCVYGVVDDFTEDGKVNVISVGIGAVLVTGPCSKGDLLESNGDGTAKVQSDDIVRSKTIGKVTIGNSEAGVKLVPCVLYCG